MAICRPVLDGKYGWYRKRENTHRRHSKLVGQYVGVISHWMEANMCSLFPRCSSYSCFHPSFFSATDDSYDSQPTLFVCHPLPFLPCSSSSMFSPPSIFHPLSLSILVDTATCHFSLSLFLFQLSLIEANTKRLSYLLCTNYRQTGRQLTASSSPSPSLPPSSPLQPSSSSSHLQQRLTTTTSNANLTGIIAISSCCCCCCTVHHQHHRSLKLSSGFILCCPLLALKCGACQRRVSKRTTKKEEKEEKWKCVPA